MKVLISTIKGLFDVVMFAFKAAMGLLNQLVSLIKYLAQALSISLSFISTLPSWLTTFATITISISILYIILGREGGAK